VEFTIGKQALYVLPAIIFVKLVGFSKGSSVNKSLQARLDSLELLYSEQDHTIQALNDIVAQQSQEISRLREQLQSQKTESASDEGSDFEIPPHY
jgi:uncharacterized coiled-coil protein SlyX